MSRRLFRRVALGPMLATLSLGASARAQEPALPPLPSVPSAIADAAVPEAELPPDGIGGLGFAGEPGTLPVAGPVACHCGGCRGAMYRLGYKIGFCLRDNVIGYPEFFREPALGRALYNNMGRQVAKADVHTFTLYRSDFIAGTAELSPGGARRLSYLASRLDGWAGPVVIEWTPDEPPLGLARREAVSTLLAGMPSPLDPARIVVGPSAYRGMTGPEAGNNHDALTFRNYTAPRSFSVTPTSTAEFGGGSR